MRWGLDGFVLLSIPLFVLVGSVMSAGSITSRILDFAMVLVGHMRAGLAQVNIVESVVFSGISGTTSSDVAGLGRIEIPMMMRAGYRAETAATITAVSACMGPLVPPSVPFILYGALTGTSIGKLFLAGAIPGLLLALTLMGVIAYRARSGRIRESRAPDREPSIGELVAAVQRSALALLTPVILVGGIVGGAFTPTEAGAVAVLYGLFLTLVLYRDLKIRDLVELFCDTAETVGVIMMVVGAAASFGWLLTQGGAADWLLELVSGLALPSWQTLVITLGLLLLIGLFVEATSMTILLSPVLVPSLSTFRPSLFLDGP